jgi:hypothetical protein
MSGNYVRLKVADRFMRTVLEQNLGDTVAFAGTRSRI